MNLSEYVRNGGKYTVVCNKSKHYFYRGDYQISDFPEYTKTCDCIWWGI